MNIEKLKKYLLEEESYSFQGWDFSYLDDRWENEKLPWDYRSIVLKYLQDDDNLLDIGTGGGEFLLTLDHPYNKTSVTEAYKPNIEICLKELSPKGIKVYPENGDDLFPNIESELFDIVIDRHESFNTREVKRVLKKQGIFITQQVGAYNNKDLATFFDENHIDQFPNVTLSKTVVKLEEEGFEIIYKNEYFPKIKFFDLGAIAYFAKIITWEFIDFSVEKCLDKFLELEKIMKKQGYVESTEHRFVIIARKI